MIHNDERMYSGGNVVFNQSPHTQLYAQLQQHKQAREEAFDEYIRGLNKSVNAAGVRNADRPIFDKQLADWQKFGIEHRDDIKKRRGGADIAFAQQHQQLLNLINESKTEEEKKKPAVEILLDPAKRDRLNGDEFMKSIHNHDQPLYVQGSDGTVQRNPDRKSLDYSSVTFNPKPFEQDKYFKQFEDVKRMEMPPIISQDPKTMTQTETTNSVFDQDAKDLIATRAVSDYSQNPSFKELVKGLKKEEYNDFFKKNYGHDIQNEGDLAAAYTLKGIQQKTTTSKVSPDTFSRQVALEGIRNANANRRLALQNEYVKGRIDYRKAAGKKEQGEVLEALIKRTFDEGAANKTPVYVDGKSVVGRKIAVPAEIAKKYTITEGSGSDKKVKAPIKFIMTEDKKYVVPVYAGESTKQRESKIPIEQYRNDLGKLYLTKKDAKSEMDELDFADETDDGSFTPSATPAKKQGAAVKHPLPSGKPKTVQQNGHVYTWDENLGTYN